MTAGGKLLLETDNYQDSLQLHLDILLLLPGGDGKVYLHQARDILHLDAGGRNTEHTLPVARRRHKTQLKAASQPPFDVDAAALQHLLLILAACDGCCCVEVL